MAEAELTNYWSFNFVMLYYVAGIILSIIGATALNYHFKWLTKDDFDGYDSADIGGFIIVGLCLWPLTLAVLAVVGVCHLFKSLFIPD